VDKSEKNEVETFQSKEILKPKIGKKSFYREQKHRRKVEGVC
jgi:hypothetical protein